MAIHITGDDAADQVLTDSPFALVVGMMLDQQYPMEHAFRGPHKVLTRFGSIDPAAIAAADPEEFAVLCSTPPAIHRYGRSMAGRLQALAKLVERREVPAGAPVLLFGFGGNLSYAGQVIACP